MAPNGRDDATAELTADGREAAHRAEAAERRLLAQTVLLAEAEHRLKNRLAVIAGWANLLADSWDTVPNDQRQQGIEAIRSCSVGLANQAEDVLGELRAEAATVELEPVSLDLAAILRATAGEWPPGPRHRIEVASVAEVPVWVDPGALQQVIGHLLENAVAYSPAGGRIVLRAGAHGDAAVLEVSDEGVGIPEGVDIFAPFVRGDSPAVEAVRGSGIGLFVVRTLVEALGGDVTVRRNEGSGSTFVVRLPNGPRALSTGAQARRQAAELLDTVTGLPNRQLSFDRLRHALGRARRSGAWVALVMADLDGFRLVNARYGRAVGDRMLHEAGRRLREAVRPGDTVARSGGDEFVVVCDDLERAADAVPIALRLAEAMRGPLVPGGDEAMAIRATVGLALARAGDADPVAMFEEAEAQVEAQRL